MRLVFKNKMVLIGTEIPSSADFYLATVDEIVIGRSQYKLIRLILEAKFGNDHLLAPCLQFRIKNR